MGTVTSCCTPPTVARTATALAEMEVTAAESVQAPRELNKLLAGGVYPDGVETEQASGYDMWRVALRAGRAAGRSQARRRWPSARCVRRRHRPLTRAAVLVPTHPPSRALAAC